MPLNELFLICRACNSISITDSYLYFCDFYCCIFFNFNKFILLACNEIEYFVTLGKTIAVKLLIIELSEMGIVKLRRKPLSSGRISLYLDFYPKVLDPSTGKWSRYEFLKIYLYNNPKTELERYHNSETLALAEHIRAIRQLDLQRLRFL